jgi:hypothetical protein
VRVQRWKKKVSCRKRCRAGVDVMITIFCDFPQFSAKKLAFFFNTNVMINFFKIWLCFELKKTPIFSLNFMAKIFKKL